MLRKTILLGIIATTFSVNSWAQKPQVISQDSLYELEEVVITSDRSITDMTDKPLSTLDHYLEKATNINMLRRGAYAWEPFINGMGSERNVVTIDGMRIYAACTDKMDPVTSYVEISNLSKANVHNGQSGSSGGATIAGSLDLLQKKSSFGPKVLKGMGFSGYETNNQQKIIGVDISYSRPKFFTDFDITYRNAENYKAGGNKEILYSQFTKYNISAITGYKINERQHVEASLIYDRATDVGYPALTMDVALAKAWIGSIEYVRHPLSPAINQWKTKLYFSDVTHIMDDSKRPNVPIRMDMPGWSNTLGFYSLLSGASKKHKWKINISGHRNKSLAEMTMYSNTPGEKDMFMLTWPGVHTNYGDIYLEDIHHLSDKLKLNINVGLGLHNNTINNQFGFESLRIFYPNMQKSNTRLLKRSSGSLSYEKNLWHMSIGMAYGERAPSVSEGYGFYLFNSFDRFDYVGNPDMKNERSLSFNGSVSYHTTNFLSKLSIAYFHLSDYIIGRPHSELSTMSIGAAGVKVYEQIKYAEIFNCSLDFNYSLTEKIQWSNKISYRRGTGKDLGNLPLIQPFNYISDLRYNLKSFSASFSAKGESKQVHFNPEFGETDLPAYVIFNLSVSNRFKLGKHMLLVKAGIENLADTQYSTFADWNRIPRIGRNIFFNMIWIL